SNRLTASTVSVTPVFAACSATSSIVSTPHFHSSFVGPAPLKLPSAEWYGPHSVTAPSASQQSTASLFPATPFARIAASGLIGLSASVRTVTAVRSNPASSSRLPHLP